MPDTSVDARLIEYLVIGGYLAVLVAVGFVFKKFNSNVSDYFRNGCKGTWWLVGSSAFMTSFSAVTFTAMAGAAFESGFGVTIIFIGNAIGFFLGFLFLAPWFRQLRCITAPEIIELRYGRATQMFYAWITMILGLLYAGLWLQGLAIFCAAVFDFTGLTFWIFDTEVEVVILLVGCVVLIYSVFGGSWAVMATDFLQFLVLMPLTLALAWLALRAVGGIDGFFQMVDARGLTQDFQFINEPGHFRADKYTLAFAVATIIYKVVKAAELDTAPKYFAVKDGWEARKAALLASVMMLLGTAVWFIPPMVGRLLYEQDVMALAEHGVSKPAEAAYAVAGMNLLPVGMTGLMVVAMFSATMSSMDTGLNRNAAIFVRDVYPALVRWVRFPQLSERGAFVLGQVFSFLFGAAIISLAYYFAQSKDKGVFELMLNVGAMLALPMGLPLLMALFVKPAPWWAAIFSVCVAMVPSSIAFMAQGTPDEWNYQKMIFIIVPTGIISYALTIPFWRFESPAYKAQVDEFFKRMHTPVDFEKEVGKGNDLSQLKIMGSFSAIIGVCICLLVFLPNPWSGRLVILFVGGTVALVGSLLAWLGSRKSPDDEEPATESIISEPAAGK
ncbi:MAG: Na+:solute symporter [Phycisphaeraceae bacterium]